MERDYTNILKSEAPKNRLGLFVGDAPCDQRKLLSTSMLSRHGPKLTLIPLWALILAACGGGGGGGGPSVTSPDSEAPTPDITPPDVPDPEQASRPNRLPPDNSPSNPPPQERGPNPDLIESPPQNVPESAPATAKVRPSL